MKVDPALPRLLPEGHYLFEITEDPTREQSQYGGYFWRYQCIAKDSNGEHHPYNPVFTQKMDQYHNFLRAIGGQTQANSITLPPDVETFKGLRFEADIHHRPAKNDREKMVAELINITAVKSEESKSEEIDSDDDTPF